MANTIQKSAELKLKYEVGVGTNGQPVYKTKTYKNVSLAADKDNILAIANSFASLQEHPLNNVEVVRTEELVG